MTFRWISPYIAGACLALSCAGRSPAPQTTEHSPDGDGRTDTVAANAARCPEAGDRSTHTAPCHEEVIAKSGETKDEVAACGRSAGLDAVVSEVQYAIAGATGAVTVLGTRPADDAFQACVQEAFDDVRFPPFAKDEFKVTFPFKLR